MIRSRMARIATLVATWLVVSGAWGCAHSGDAKHAKAKTAHKPVSAKKPKQPRDTDESGYGLYSSDTLNRSAWQRGERSRVSAALDGY